MRQNDIKVSRKNTLFRYLPAVVTYLVPAVTAIVPRKRPPLIRGYCNLLGSINCFHQLHKILGVLYLDNRFCDVSRSICHMEGNHQQEGTGKNHQRLCVLTCKRQRIRRDKDHRHQLVQRQPRNLFTDVRIGKTGNDRPVDCKPDKLLLAVQHCGRLRTAEQIRKREFFLCRFFCRGFRTGDSGFGRFKEFYIRRIRMRDFCCRFLFTRSAQEQDDTCNCTEKNRQFIQHKQEQIVIRRTCDALLVMHGQPVFNRRRTGGKDNLRMCSKRGVEQNNDPEKHHDCKNHIAQPGFGKRDLSAPYKIKEEQAERHQNERHILFGTHTKSRGNSCEKQIIPLPFLNPCKKRHNDQQ